MPTQTAKSHHLGSFAVYQATSGQIIHLIAVECLPGAVTPSLEQIEQEAILSAAHISGFEGASLAVLSLGETVLRPTSLYRVDPASRTLVEQPRPAAPKVELRDGV